MDPGGDLSGAADVPVRVHSECLTGDIFGSCGCDCGGQLRAALRERLNLREAPAARADVVVRGTLVKYDVDLPAGLSADGRQTTSTRRRLIIVLDVEIIDQTTGRTLLSKKGLQREGQYAEGGEVAGRKNALESLISDLVEGVQSQW